MVARMGRSGREAGRRVREVDIVRSAAVVYDGTSGGSEVGWWLIFILVFII